MGESFDFEFIRHMVQQAFRLLNQDYFRAQLVNLQKVPEKQTGRPRIFFSNHSGMAFPWDAIVFNTMYWESRGMKDEDLPRPLVAPMLMQNKFMSPYMIDDLWARGGCLEASLENFEILMHEGRDVVMYPEGVPGIGKGFDRRYQIQKFSTSFLRMAMQYDAELIPFHTINAEFLHPYSYRNDRLNRFVQKLGIPFLPLSPLTALIPVFPWMFYFSLPANIHYVFADPIRPSDLTGKSYESLRRSDYIRMRDDIHSEFQKGINVHVEQFGQDPFRILEFAEKLLSDPQKGLFLLPSGWPILMTGLQKLYDDGIKKQLTYTYDEFIALAARALDGLSFSLPFSWPLVFGMKGMAVDLVKTVGHFIEEEFGGHPAAGLHGVHGTPAPEAASGAVVDTLEEALRLLEEHELDPANLSRAESILLSHTKGPSAARAFGLLAEVQYWRGMESSGDKSLIYEKGVAYGEKGVAADPECVEANFWLAVNYGLLGEARGILDSLFLVKPIEKHLQKCMELDERYFLGGPHRALGWVLHKLPPWPLSHGDNRGALEHLEKALEAGPDFPLNHLYAAHICVSLKEFAKAKKHAEAIVNAPLSPVHAREEGRYREEARELLAKLP